MGTRYFNRDEVQDLIWEDSVQEKQVDSGRWDAYMEVICLADDGKHYKIEWPTGLTEMQEDSIEGQEAQEVELVEEMVLVKKWVPVLGENSD